MKTRQQDQGRLIQCGAYVPDAAAGSGVFQPGSIPFTSTRIGTGSYRIDFDGRILPRTASSGAAGATNGARVFSFAAGTMTTNTYNNNTLTNDAQNISMVALDRRT
jgi:hypothetical protein